MQVSIEELKHRICRECGARCCKRFDYNTWYVTLSLRDIVRLSKGLNKNIGNVLTEYVYIKFVGKYPILILKSVNGKCLFLQDDKCTIQKFKPIACRVYPVFIPGTYIDHRCPLSKYPELLRDEERYVEQYIKEHMETEELLARYSPKTAEDIEKIIRKEILK